MAESAFEMTPSRKGYCARRTLVQWWRSFSCVATLKIGHLTKGEDMRGQCWQLKCKCVYITFCTPRFTCHELDFSRLLYLFEIQLLKKKSAPVPHFFFPVNFPGLTTIVGVIVKYNFTSGKVDVCIGHSVVCVCHSKARCAPLTLRT